jgi:hypothetical protein
MNADGPTASSSTDAGRRGRLMIGVRYVLPGLITLAGAIVMTLGSEADLEGGVSIVSAGLVGYLTSWLYRISAYGDGTRQEQEEAARDYLSLHGHWPDESPGRALAEGALLVRDRDAEIES